MARRCHHRRNTGPLGVFLAGLFLIGAVVAYWYVVVPATVVLVTLYVLIQRDGNRVV